ncbi:MAG: hypothetical protein U0M46_05970 [Anaerostipes hadrus]|jgi:chromosome segregation ATPase|nr:MAG TPA: Mitochondrial import inner membrane translocase-fold, CHAPERONE, PROTEIN TRANSPORT [Caudoviricetes sp.]
MSSLDVIYFLVLLGTGFVLGWGFHLIKTENEMEADIGDIEDIEEQYERKLEYAEYEISTLRRENHKLQIRVSVLRSDITALRTENVAHVQKYKESPEVKEAVKYAMKSAHPDNGGDAKDFMKFRELYNKIK